MEDFLQSIHDKVIEIDHSGPNLDDSDLACLLPRSSKPKAETKEVASECRSLPIIYTFCALLGLYFLVTRESLTPLSSFFFNTAQPKSPLVQLLSLITFSVQFVILCLLGKAYFRQVPSSERLFLLLALFFGFSAIFLEFIVQNSFLIGPIDQFNSFFTTFISVSFLELLFVIRLCLLTGFFGSCIYLSGFRQKGFSLHAKVIVIIYFICFALGYLVGLLCERKILFKDITLDNKHFKTVLAGFPFLLSTLSICFFATFYAELKDMKINFETKNQKLKTEYGNTDL